MELNKEIKNIQIVVLEAKDIIDERFLRNAVVIKIHVYFKAG